MAYPLKGAFVGSLGVLALTIGPASGQSSEQTGQRGYVSWFGGSTFGNQTSGDIGGRVGVDVGRHVEVLGTIGYDHNVLNSILQVDLLTAVPGGQVRGALSSYSAGLRLLAPVDRAHRVRPYVQMATGAMRLNGSVKGADGTDLTSTLTTDTVPDVKDLSATKFMVGVGGGVEVSRGRRMLLDAGYAWGRPIDTATTLNVNQVYRGVGVRL